MATKYKKSAADARERSVGAKESSDRHSREAAYMKKHADTAATHFDKAQKRQRDREANKKPRKG